MTATTHIASRGSAALLAAFATLASALALTTPAETRAGSSTYSWPVKPFDQPHPVRANFGDPRTTFHGPATHRGLMTAGGSFSFHFGIDISVPDGTLVYAVRSGVASSRGGRNVHVDSGNGFATEYWHIVPTIHAGQQVVAYETVLGHTMKGYEHVHFTEFDRGRPVNPLAPGHLEPYTDETAPVVADIGFRRSDIGEEVLPELVSGRVVMVARAFDVSAQPVPGIWGGLPVAPALVTWRVERAKDHAVVLRERTAFDVRETIPANGAFWQYYARGSRQNMCTFNEQRAWRGLGVYLYKLTRTAFDTRRLHNGIYELIVTATDIRDNASSSRQVFIVRNGQGS